MTSLPKAAGRYWCPPIWYMKFDFDWQGLAQHPPELSTALAEKGPAVRRLSLPEGLADQE